MMQLNALIVVDEQMLFLSNCEHCLVMQEAHVSDDLLGLKFTD